MTTQIHSILDERAGFLESHRGMSSDNRYALRSLGPTPGFTTAAVPAMLFDVSLIDPITLLSSSCMLLTIGALACFPPAGRAMRVEPLNALRTE